MVDPFPYIYSPSTAKFSFPMSLFTVPGPTLNSPYVHDLNFTVEKTLPGGLIWKGAYVGKLEHNLLQMLRRIRRRTSRANRPSPIRISGAF